jgi:hypothetical protein
MLENVRFHLEEEGSVKDKEGKKVRHFDCLTFTISGLIRLS